MYVRGIGRTISKEELTIYFQSRKQSGGGDISSIDLNGDEAVITFEDDDGTLCLHLFLVSQSFKRKILFFLYSLAIYIRLFHLFLYPFDSRSMASFRFHFQYLSSSCGRNKQLFYWTRCIKNRIFLKHVTSVAFKKPKISKT